MAVSSIIFYDASSSKNVEMFPVTLAIMVEAVIVADIKIKLKVQWRLLVNAFVKRL
jgi:hypothetical protein